MLKTKTFQFLVSNHAGNPHMSEDPGFTASMNAKYPVKTEAEIDAEVNRWISKSKADVVSISANTYTIHHHNNARNDSVVLVYTLLYKAQDKAKD
jgi:hypothetical protein